MVIEFLTQEKNIRSKLEGIAEDGVSLSLVDQSERKATLIRFETKESSITAAKKLEKLYDEVTLLKFSVPVLDERSQFFHSRLFPLINKYECLLRKLLIVSGTQNKEKIKNKDYEQLMRLESYDLSKLHNLLFTDKYFNSQAKSILTEDNKRQYTKEELIKKLSKIKEEPLWDKLFVKDLLTDLRASFTELQEYRNIVMHARIITYKVFVSAKELFERINKQIETEIERLEYHPQKNPSSSYFDSIKPFVLPNYTENLISAIKQIDSFVPAVKLYEIPSVPYLSAIEQLQAYTEPIVSAVNQLQKATDPSTYAVMQISEQWKRHYEINIKPAIQAINMNYPSFSKATESLRSMSLPFEKMVSATKEIADKTNIGDMEE